MMLDARDCFENNGGIRLCRLKMPFALQNKTENKGGQHHKREQTMIKKKEGNRQTEQNNLQKGSSISRRYGY